MLMSKKINTKEKIMKITFEILMSSSYHKVSIDEIIKKAGVSKGGLFHYFNSKYDLATQAISYSMLEMWMQYMNDLETIKSPEKRLKKLIDLSIDMTIENPKIIMLFVELIEEGIRNGTSSESWTEFLDRFVKVFGDIFAECNIPHPYIKAKILIACLDAIGMQALLLKESGKALARKSLKKEIYELFVGNYLNNTS